MSSGGRRRIGLFGGTFDPPHIAHLLVAVEARDQLGLDEVVMMVANDPWQKRDRVVSAAALRLEMTRAAVDELDGVTVGDHEIRRGGPTYAIDTVEELRCDGASEVALIVGSDAAARLDTWHRAAELAALVVVAVVERPGTAAQELAPRWRRSSVAVPSMDVSSTDIRHRVAVGRSTQVLVHRQVRAVIDRAGLYRLDP